jgi:hypothetical protein
LDEMSKNDHNTAQQYGRSMSSECADFADNLVQGDHYSMVVALTIDRYIVAEVVAESYNTDLFYEFVQEKVVRQFLYPLYVP